ncbi:Two-component sensor histidine kinase [Legionella busanensis]|uniref:histidine kinase n=1 Tax=Legionella busanensis TaxID=190655 RepID=A0A378JJD9_9GAMM|nr:ATP-binding protein [Legionella busanensis]STX50433.1 Two-component sensor histidine kinase [Legionella busanensis]
MQRVDILLKQLEREKRARREAENIGENQCRVLYQINQELENLSNNLVDKEKNTRAILEATPDGILVMDEQFQVVRCNKAACRLFDYPAKHLEGKSINKLIEFISPNQSTLKITSLLLAIPTDSLTEFIAIKKDKSRIPIELAISTVDLTDKISIICVLRNIFDRKMAEQRVTMHHELVRLMAEHTSLDEIAPKILKTICEFMGLDEGALWKVDEVNKVLRCVDTWIKSKEISNFAETISKNMTFSYGVGLPGTVWQNKSIKWISDIKAELNFPRSTAAQEVGLRSGFALPILFEGKVLGVLEFFKKETQSPDKKTIELLNDISNQLGIFIEKEQAQKKVSTLSRLSGMSEVASSILHNVGNTLNSINTSVQMIQENLNLSKMPKLAMIADLCVEHAKNKGTLNDAKGQYIPEFLTLLAQEWKEENLHLTQEIITLRKNVHHIKRIIEMQQSFNYLIKTTELISPAELIEHALIIHELESKHSDIKIIRNFKPVPKIKLDRVKLLQIILNLIKNGIDAMTESNKKKKVLQLNLYDKDNSIIIEVIDNGIGIQSSNLTKIFSNGFTTKKLGHGLGLHTSALFAKELGGNLQAKSSGLNKGAILILTLPKYSSEIDS